MFKLCFFGSFARFCITFHTNFIIGFGSALIYREARKKRHCLYCLNVLK